ncbi:hypothetical protein L6452_30939 [Arctium lappa]|uniref:Uncharacterized protein n=1 Tax=Arctium lappa TaxID=4217 RepID=A0ACB8ZKH3_ARCLA|nr:hypothetical protein L6452_30939 [Arctium lappa]
MFQNSLTSRDALSIGTDVKPLVLFKDGPMKRPTGEIPSEDYDSDGVQNTKRVEKDFSQFTDEQKSRFDADKEADLYYYKA